jgi:hypothetical protein
MSLHVTPTTNLVLVLTLKRGKELFCQVLDQHLGYSRWYHFAFDYSAAGVLNVYLNGISVSVSCTSEGTNRISLFGNDNFLMKRIGFVPTGDLEYLTKTDTDEPFFLTLGSCSGSSAELTPEDFLFSGMISNFTMYMSALSEENIRKIAQQWVVVEGAALLFSEPALRSEGGPVGYAAGSGADTPARVNSTWHVMGTGAVTADPLHGDAALSMLLTVAEIKTKGSSSSNSSSSSSSSDEADVSRRLGSMMAMTGDSEVTTNIP